MDKHYRYQSFYKMRVYNWSFFSEKNFQYSTFVSNLVIYIKIYALNLLFYNFECYEIKSISWRTE